ncbi:hypothetical protein GCM10010916_47010 [Paenibacillus abyssi]|uniref:Uncharacterized protein n=2 Tax=Paenibacillus abyssi TaxID=1340531 RepID=A0A917LHV2_9BACL|nr:hypothetical protein GCM10010916_47010 [Paenibacillus abyssi]
MEVRVVFGSCHFGPVSKSRPGGYSQSEGLPLRFFIFAYKPFIDGQASGMAVKVLAFLMEIGFTIG